MNRFWIYSHEHHCWHCSDTGELGTPRPGDAYWDGYNWAIW